ncbi:Adaptor protein complex AP-3 delta subunit [Nadsonia fulvescens var. elongata DSM 6958]|uniref:AP-3 complex subunit delta n=1 Tax=Nadsonia fulvescens var. elongata DSM 6958 TaxID=857566 RepID=A0A1E3PQ14_9ASCO|nr:Adaptor protein complex AP-3 delta subunit [Nadsonia fulvescens var. elongata DSM 6958]
MSLQVKDLRLKPFGLAFEKSISDLIRGIRAAKDPESKSKVLLEAIGDCHNEVRSQDMEVKSMAVLKLAYLEMYGYDMSWANFHVLEVMSSPKFQQKRIGYLAAIQSYRDNTDILMMTTNQLKKDLSSSNSVEVSVALSGVATIVTPSLAQDITPDIVKMLNHSKPYIRKKAVLAMYKIFLQFPEALRTSFSRLRDKLQDEDMSVVSATVNVVCELAKKNPKNFLPLAPQLFEHLTISSSNWMIIKILKLFASLAPIEPRLKPKLLPPIMEIIQKTEAMSLLYECINCVVTGNMIDEEDYDIARVLVSKLRTFLDQSDQNLKYVGLLAFSKIVKIHPQFVNSQEDVILQCVLDPDLTIRQKSLELISQIMNDDNVETIVTILLKQLIPPVLSPGSENYSTLDTPDSYKINVIRTIIEACSRDNFAILSDFDWYITVLVDLVKLSKTLNEVGSEIGVQIRDISIRVPSVRNLCVEVASNFVHDDDLLQNNAAILGSCIWILGEFASLLNSPIYTLNYLLEVDADALPSKIHALYIQAIVKIFAFFSGDSSIAWTVSRADQIKGLTRSMIKYLEKSSTSVHYDVQERSVEFLELMKLVLQGLEEYEVDKEDMYNNDIPLLLTLAVPSLFNRWDLNPVAPNTQFKIGVPDDLDLNTQIGSFDGLGQNYEDSDADSDDDFIGCGVRDEIEQEYKNVRNHFYKDESPAVDEKEVGRQRRERINKQRDDPYYIGNEDDNEITSISGKSTIDDGPTPVADLDANIGSLSSNALKPCNNTESSLKKRKKFKFYKMKPLETMKLQIMIPISHWFQLAGRSTLPVERNRKRAYCELMRVI